jgi:dUTP pyrophosphatase
MHLDVELKVLNDLVNTHPKMALPEYKTEGAAAMDLQACIEEPVKLEPGERFLIPTGIALNIKSPDVALFLLPRSGLGHKHGIILGNGTGLIDPDYQGELLVSAFNSSGEPYTISVGDRICQAVFLPIIKASMTQVDEFSSNTERGEGGFGSTGL